MGWASSRGPKAHQSNSWSGHMTERNIQSTTGEEKMDDSMSETLKQALGSKRHLNKASKRYKGLKKLKMAAEAFQTRRYMTK